MRCRLATEGKLRRPYHRGLLWARPYLDNERDFGI